MIVIEFLKELVVEVFFKKIVMTLFKNSKIKPTGDKLKSNKDESYREKT